MKQNKPFDSKILLIILGAILALLLFSCTNQRPAIQTVTFDANGGKLSGEASVTVFTGFPVSEPKAPTRSGYSFSGWYLEGSSTKYDFSSPVFSDITLKAQWNKTPTSYTVTYHALVDGQESTDIEVPASTTAQSGSTLQTPAPPQYYPAGMTFVGWSTSKTEYSALTADYTVRGPVELWAVFITETKSQMTSDDNMLMYVFDEINGGYTVKAGTVATGEVVIPSTINGAPVVEIETRAFWENTAITAINLSKATNLKTIGDSAFYKTGITSLTIPGNVETVGRWIVEGCSSLSRITLEEGVKNLSQSSFYGAAVKSIKIPSTITEIPAHCFVASEIESIELHDGITAIGYGAFMNCSNLTALTIPGSVKSIGQYILQIDSKDSNASIKVVIEEGASGLSEYSFWGAPIASISIPKSVTIIPSHCFQDATLLTSVKLHNDITEIQPYAFSNTGIKQITLPANLEKIDNFAFANCALTALSLPEGLTYIGEQAFRSNPITGTLIIPASVTEIGQIAFYDTNISGIVFKEGANLKIGSEAFASTNLRDVMFPSLTARLYIDAFSYSTNHSSNSGVGLHSITVQADNPAQITLFGASANAVHCTLYVPDGAVNNYKASTNWCAQNRFDAGNIEPVSNKPTS